VRKKNTTLHSANSKGRLEKQLLARQGQEGLFFIHRLGVPEHFAKVRGAGGSVINLPPAGFIILNYGSGYRRTDSYYLSKIQRIIEIFYIIFRELIPIGPLAI
jgi:hypothetical protein